ncbi:hypothetical protein JVT61DRAFT_10005 [Boletus reticuloceps]|uniref:Uncharacterized protein n=1 Tax=Boletus reticuloceps TaxID=495285 RepID=A0A8I2YWY0_9AGAM|nr:hypothetical protein JVT61DRAFT_10929 [Boletus reticuloceps]KAG6379514.1 hypothetical protein JVT61DRAFT_10005 [Boletus reticuloceps]
MVDSVPAFLDKLARHRPRFVCFVGIVIWEIVRNGLAKLPQQGMKKVGKGRSKKKNQMGLQTYKLVYGNEIECPHLKLTLQGWNALSGVQVRPDHRCRLDVVSLYPGHSGTYQNKPFSTIRPILAKWRMRTALRMHREDDPICFADREGPRCGVTPLIP